MAESSTRGITGVAVGAAVGAGLVVGVNSLVDFGLRADDPRFSNTVFDFVPGSVPPFPLAAEMADTVRFNTAWLDESVECWLDEATGETVTIPVDGGRLRLSAQIVYADVPTNHWAVLVHGYRGSHAEMYSYAVLYALRGFNVLMCDLRAHGASDGVWIGMGWPDADDVIAWTHYLLGRFGGDIDIVLHGHSMGAATVLCTTSRDLPDAVTAVIADAGYTDVWDIFAFQIERVAHLPAAPILHAVNVCFKLRGGYDLKRASALESVARARVPILLVHGTDDTFVPPIMSQRLFDACASPLKELNYAQGAGHVMSLLVDPTGYADMVFGFLDRAYAVSDGTRA